MKIKTLSNYFVYNFGKRETFWEQLDDDDTQLTIELSVTGPENAVLKYRISEPNQRQFSTYQNVTSNMKPLRFTGKGKYEIEICNLEKQPVYFQFSTHIDKEIEADENTQYIKSVIEKLKTDLRNLYNSSMQLSIDKRNNIRDARNSRNKLVWLCFLPIGYVLIGVAKYKMMKNMFMPKRSKR